MWVSPQSFNQAWLDEFFAILRERASGLAGRRRLWTASPCAACRTARAVPAQYPIRHYPDITHSRQCQYPVPDWDVAYAVTEARECINPRPQDEAAIFRATADQIRSASSPTPKGATTTSTKPSGARWAGTRKRGPSISCAEYSRYFIGTDMADDFAQGLLALERNWRGPLLANAGVETTLRQFQAMERVASPAQLKNWRFQQALFRAYYDAYTRVRLMSEKQTEQGALEALATAGAIPSLQAIASAERILDDAPGHTAGPALARTNSGAGRRPLSRALGCN